jgi:plastocyanin
LKRKSSETYGCPILSALFALRVGILTSLLLVGALGATAQVSLKAHVELTAGRQHMKDASEAVVWLTPLGTIVPVPVQTSIPQLVQKNKSFQPPLVVIPVGGKVEFPNHDPFFHNVFSLFEGKRFDLGLYESGTTRTVQFDKPGVSFIFCNIHVEMNAIVIALATPYYAISDARGDITIPNVPPGRYRMQAFHSSVAPETLRAMSHEITVTPGDSSIGTLTFAEANLGSHKNKYGRDYDRPDPNSPAYDRPQ